MRSAVGIITLVTICQVSAVGAAEETVMSHQRALQDAKEISQITPLPNDGETEVVPSKEEPPNMLPETEIVLPAEDGIADDDTAWFENIDNIFD